MTRETKIGLLVGLAFIIVIGILLSDHLTSATEPQQAPLVQAGESVRESVSMPGTGEAPISMMPAAPADASPQQPVPTRDELTLRSQSPVQIVKITGPSQPQQQQPLTIQ